MTAATDPEEMHRKRSTPPRARKAPKRFTEDGRNPASRWVEGLKTDVSSRKEKSSSSPRDRTRRGEEDNFGTSSAKGGASAAPSDASPSRTTTSTKRRRHDDDDDDSQSKPKEEDGVDDPSHPPTKTPDLKEDDSDDEHMLEELIEVTLATLPLTRTHVEFVLAEPGTATFVARKRHATYVLGGAASRRAHETLCQLTFLSVDFAFRRRRVGSRLLRAVLDHAARHQVHRVAVYADDTAVGFFARHGFKLDPPDFPTHLRATLDVYSNSKLMVCDVASSMVSSSSSSSEETAPTA